PISDYVDRAYAFMAIAAAQVERGDRKGALTSIARSRQDVLLDAGPRAGEKFLWSSDLPGTVGIQARAGEIAEALRVARAIEAPVYRAVALASIAPHQSIGDRTGAVRTVEEASKALRAAFRRAAEAEEAGLSPGERASQTGAL